MGNRAFLSFSYGLNISLRTFPGRSAEFWRKFSPRRASFPPFACRTRINNTANIKRTSAFNINWIGDCFWGFLYKSSGIYIFTRGSCRNPARSACVGCRKLLRKPHVSKIRRHAWLINPELLKKTAFTASPGCCCVVVAVGWERCG